jgi:Rrf2 family transcriptional regulator, cysteine metabolism repressor
VKLSVKSDYAARAVFGLARHFATGEALKVEQIAEENGLPRSFLVQILLELKARQIVRSVRGNQGGYLLARPPGQISLGDVLRCFHGEVFDTPALSDPQCPAEVRRAWATLQRALNTAADSLTFQQMLDETVEGKMFYI